MLNSIFSGLFDAASSQVISVSNFLICIGVSILIGLFLAAVNSYKNHCTKSFITTLSLLPAVVCVCCYHDG